MHTTKGQIEQSKTNHTGELAKIGRNIVPETDYSEAYIREQENERIGKVVNASGNLVENWALAIAAKSKTELNLTRKIF